MHFAFVVPVPPGVSLFRHGTSLAPMRVEMRQSGFRGRLIETKPSRAIDLRPRLARAIDALDALGEADCASVFERVRHRIDDGSLQGFSGRPHVLHEGT